ncbi:hypothetical protein KJ925_00250 [Patescibacteria group bacterium]|nr:hypothetical protein [Patescibacteria group bacterium]
MGIFLRTLIGLAIASAGTFMVLKTRVILGFFGPVAWADAKLGGGGSNLFYKLIGIVIALIGFLVATNLWEAFLQATLGSIFGFGQT